MFLRSSVYTESHTFPNTARFARGHRARVVEYGKVLTQWKLAIIFPQPLRFRNAFCSSSTDINPAHMCLVGGRGGVLSAKIRAVELEILIRPYRPFPDPSPFSRSPCLRRSSTCSLTHGPARGKGGLIALRIDLARLHCILPASLTDVID